MTHSVSTIIRYPFFCQPVNSGIALPCCCDPSAAINGYRCLQRGEIPCTSSDDGELAKDLARGHYLAHRPAPAAVPSQQAMQALAAGDTTARCRCWPTNGWCLPAGKYKFVVNLHIPAPFCKTGVIARNRRFFFHRKMRSIERRQDNSCMYVARAHIDPLRTFGAATHSGIPSCSCFNERAS